MWKLKRESNGRNNESNGVKYEGVGSLNGLILEKGPDGSGRVYLINHAMVPRRRSVTVLTTRHWFRRVCSNFIMTQKCTWYDGCIRRSVAGATVRRCIRQ